MTSRDAAIVLTAPKPLMRGVSHAGVALLAPVGLVVLLLLAGSPSAYVGAAIFAASVCGLYTTSATYHLLPWRGMWRHVIGRLDHSMIFALIAGTYTPFCLIVLGYGGWGITLLALIWSLAATGILSALAWPHAPRWLGVALYIGLGWLALIAASEIVQRLTLTELSLLALGGLFYTAGALVYAIRRPDPSPRVFGFHEVFHVFVILGSLAHFTVLAFYIIPS